MLKRSYSRIAFPLNDKTPDAVLCTYLKEFGADSTQSILGVKAIFVNALRDFFDGNIGEWELGSLCFALVTNRNIATTIENDLLLKKYVTDCVEIMWLSKGENYGNYKSELKKYVASCGQMKNFF